MEGSLGVMGHWGYGGSEVIGYGGRLGSEVKEGSWGMGSG